MAPISIYVVFYFIIMIIIICSSIALNNNFVSRTNVSAYHVELFKYNILNSILMDLLFFNEKQARVERE